MNLELGSPIAYGATAEIYAWEEGQILKLFFDWFGRENIEYEARMARAVYASGLPVPAVGEMVVVNGRIGLIYERVAGKSLFEVMPSKPWTIFRYARRMAEMHVEMHANPLEPEIPRQRERLVRKIKAAKALPDALRVRVLATLAKMPDGNQICHGDFHPGNVMASPQSEIIIDWIDATRGNPLADLARSSIIALGAAASSQTPKRTDKMFVRLFHRLYLRHYFSLRSEGRGEYGRWLPIVAAARLSENIPELEQWLLAQAEKAVD
ncbi:phosphotransferase family protein [Candidatus Leptofilum sp.]|uniref:phosphotransferase family protein n=1 Tax=Candidatus Leptofilum sp. TaxID=3241576 RepID=UPI003B5B6A3D